jgi:hypothetical protein
METLEREVDRVLLEGGGGVFSCTSRDTDRRRVTGAGAETSWGGTELREDRLTPMVLGVGAATSAGV